MVIKPSLSFYRTRNESEIDFVIELGDKLIPIEVKSGSQVKSQSLKSFYGFFEDYSTKFNIPFGIVLHRGERPCFLSKQILGVPINLLY
jgi:predicted AAA+ superfamily ATPase